MCVCTHMHPTLTCPTLTLAWLLRAWLQVCVCVCVYLQLVVTSDDHGMVKLFNYPCVVNDAPHRAYRGHSSHVMGVRFNSEDSIVRQTHTHTHTLHSMRTCMGSTHVYIFHRTGPMHDLDKPGVSRRVCVSIGLGGKPMCFVYRMGASHAHGCSMC